MNTLKTVFKDYRRPLTKWGIVIAIILLLALPAMFNKQTDTPLDPKSAKPDGTKAFAMLMQQAGASFSIGDRPSTGTAVLLSDTLSNDESTQVQDWVRSGGRLVVADVYSSLIISNLTKANDVQTKNLKAECDASYASDVNEVRPNSSADYSLFRYDSNTKSACFPYKSGYFVSEQVVGKGSIIELGSPTIFMNQDIGNADNAVLITNLVKPAAGQDIVWLTTDGVTANSGSSGGQVKLGRLIPSRVKQSLFQLGIAALVLILWRSRRLGRPVAEEPLVQIPASQLVTATGRLLETANRTDDAAAMMRYDVKRSFAQLLGIDVNVADNVLIDILHSRTNIPKNRLEAVLITMPSSDNTQLISLAQQIEYLYMEVSRVR